MARQASLIAAALLLTACGKDSPPSACDLQLGETVNDSLEVTDSIADGSHEDRWGFDLAAGQRVRIELRADSFDARLRLRGPSGRIRASNDDGLGRDAALTFRARQGGRYTAIARSVGAKPARGSYALSVEELVEPVAGPGESVALAIGDSITGVLETGDSLTTPARGWDVAGTDARGWAQFASVRDTRRGLVDYYEFRPERTGAVVVDLTSTHFDAYLAIGERPSSPRYETEAGSFHQIVIDSIAHDDDGGEGENSRLRYRVEAGRRYRVAAASFGAEAGNGLYRLTVRMAAGGPVTPAARTHGLTLARLARPELRLCEGKPIRFAAPYDPTRHGFHPFQAVELPGDPGHDSPANARVVPGDLAPRSVVDDPKQLELVLCLVHTEIVLQRCKYSGGPSITHYRHRWVGQLREAGTGRLVMETQVDGGMPGACGVIEPRSVTRIDGSVRTSYDAILAMRAQLARWVDPAGASADSTAPAPMQPPTGRR